MATTMSAESPCSARQDLSADHEKGVLLTDRDVREILRKKLLRDDFRVVDWRLQPVTEKNGFLGQYYHLHATVKTENGPESLRFFAKTPPPLNSPQLEFLERYDTFNKEIVVYTEIIRRMGTGRGPKWLVDCYLCKRDAIMVLEDATVDGYVTPDKYVTFDERHCVWMLRALSRLHSRSLILDEQFRRAGSSILDIYGHLLDEVLFVEHDEKSRRALAASIKGSCSMIDLVDGLKDEERTLVKDRIAVWGQRLPRLLRPSARHRNAICHRDVWSNNLLFKRDSSGDPTNCYIIDFQFARYCPLAYDFAFSLYLTTDRATRDSHYEPFMKIYHESFGLAMAEEGLDAHDCLPWVAFRESCREARRVALVYAMMNLQIMLLTGEATEEYFAGSPDRLEQVLYGDKRSELVCHQYRTVPAYRERIAEIVREIRDRLPDQPPDV